VTHKIKLIPAIGLMTLAVGVTGCAGKVRYPSYYVLNPSVPQPRATESGPLGGSVAVREFAAPDYLKQGPIVYREPGNRLGFYEYNRWAVDPRRAVTDAIIRELQSRDIFRSVGPYDGRGAPDYILTGEILHLEEVDDGVGVSSEVTLSARLTDVHSGNLFWQDTASQTARLDQRSIPGLVGEMSRDLAREHDPESGLFDEETNQPSTAGRTLNGRAWPYSI
jgi:uncharacterized lipoprotein YmbA